MRTGTQVRLSLYERGIAEALVGQFGYAAAVARQLVIRYIAVIRKLGGYEPCSHYAQLLDRAHRADHPPEKWLEHIREAEKGELRDPGFEQEERQYLQTR